MHRKTLAIIAVSIIVLVTLSLLTLNLLNPPIPHKYEQTISRNVNNQEEEKAITAAESINYSAITSFERFHGSSEPEAYLHPGTYLEYTGANFIDSEVINYYQTRYADLQGKEDPKCPKGIELTYEANVTKFSDFRIYNSPAPQGVTWHNGTIVMSAPQWFIRD